MAKNNQINKMKYQIKLNLIKSNKLEAVNEKL